jgi:carboxylesterase
LTDPREVFAVRGSVTRDQVEPFAFDRGPIGCVLLHGFTAAPKEMRELGEYLAARNYTVCGVRLAGHGTCPEDLARTTWRDWVASAREAIDQLRERCTQVWAIGLSLGGLIGLYLASRDDGSRRYHDGSRRYHVVHGVIALAPPILAPDRRMRYARWLWRFRPYSSKGLADLHDPEALAHHADYDRFPTRATAELYALICQVRRDLPFIHQPLLLIHARHDRVVALAGADYIWQRVSSIDKERLTLERGGHIITEDYDKEVAFARINDFLAKHTG